MMLASLERKGLLLLNQWKAARLAKKEKELRDRKNYEYTERIAQAKNALDLVRENFDFVTDEAVKEYYIYMIKAEETKLNYFLSCAKKDEAENPCFFTPRLHPDEKGCVPYGNC
ncbi:MAG: DUF2508 family protein [Clostridia bacterium]|nr:DUF2508 family protein [Clostridia bacterium]